jgi:general secretion pathway protein D
MSNLRRSATVLWCFASGVSGSALLLAAPQMPQESDRRDDRTVSATIVEGQPQRPIVTPQPVQIRGGDISLNFPSADVRVVAKAVLADVLKVPYSVAPGLTTAVTVVTPKPIARSSIIGFLEEALRVSGLALSERGGVFTIELIDQARSNGSVGATIGFTNEIYQLQFVSADEMKRLLDPVLPGVVTQADGATGRLTLSGTTGQRASARDLLKQFDVNWLRNMSFALFVPQRSDSRLIVPELEKLINAPDAPTRGLVRLISMEKLNGILAISSQRQYLDDVNRFVEILDREGQNNEPRLFVYRVQNGRSRDLTRTLNNAFGNSSTSSGSENNSQAIQFEQSPDGGNGRERPGSGQGQRDERQSNQPPQPNLNAVSPPVDTFGGSGDSGGGQGLLKARISSDDNNNAILVYGTPREYALIEEALRKLDVLPFQVFIEAAITEVNLTDNLRFGLQWSFSPDNSNGVLTEGTGSTNGIPNLVRNVPGFSFAFSPSSTINGVLNTLESRTKVNVVSAPKILVLNNQTAVLQVGDQVPIATQNSTSTIDPNAPTINSIEYRDTGVILKVTPRVNASGLVLLDVAQEVSDVNTTVARGAGINSPTISTRRVSTSVAVQDGEVLALGGLIRNTQTKDRVGLPFLSQIPFIGGLFGRQATGGNKIELIVLLKPRVIRTVDDGRAITDELRAKIKSLEPFKSSGQIP